MKGASVSIWWPDSAMEFRRDLETLSQIPVGGSNGQQIVPLGQLAKLEYATGPAQISREQIQRRIVVEANVRGRDLGGFVREARARVGREREARSRLLLGVGRAV